MNKPIAWIDKNTGKPRMEGFIQTDHDIPLYTHPVKEQELLAEIEALKAEVKQWEEWKESLNGWSKK